MEFLSILLVVVGLFLFMYLFVGNFFMATEAHIDYKYGRNYKNIYRLPNAILYHLWWKIFAQWYKRTPKDIAARNARLFNMEGK